MNIITINILLLLLLAACTAAKNPAAGTADEPQVNADAVRQVPDCGLEPIKVPTLPKAIPGYTELDPASGLHMTGTVQVIDFPSYRLKVTGLVEQPLSLHYDELRCLPKVTASPLLVCRGFFEDRASWSGVPIAEILKLARLLPEAKHVSLISKDGYTSTFDLEDALKPENFLAYELEGQPIPVLHGFPLRAVFPKKEGNSWVKWLVGINVF